MNNNPLAEHTLHPAPRITVVMRIYDDGHVITFNDVKWGCESLALINSEYAAQVVTPREQQDDLLIWGVDDLAGEYYCEYRLWLDNGIWKCQQHIQGEFQWQDHVSDTYYFDSEGKAHKESREAA